MLKKSERMTRTQFSEYFKTGKRYNFPHITIVHTPLSNLHASVVISKKVAKQAVRRNTIRRRVYAQLYGGLKTTNQTGVFIVLVKPSLISLARKDANQEIKENIAVVLKKT